MSFEKNMNIGKISLNNPHIGYVHSLELLSFSDFIKSFSLGITYNPLLNDNYNSNIYIWI